MKFVLFIILLFSFLKSHAQMVGADAYVKGNYIEFGVSGIGGNEAIYTSASPVPAGYHQRPVNSSFGILANPQMNGWGSSAYDGDFLTYNIPENGWGFEIYLSSTLSCIASNNATSATQIVGSITGFSDTPTEVNVDWDGNYVGSGYDLSFHINYNLLKYDLFYTTSVSITNNGALIPEYYYYRTIDPDNNASISGLQYTTSQNTSQPSGLTDRAQVISQQSTPWNSVISFVGNGQNFKASYGGTTMRRGYYIYNNMGGSITAVGPTLYSNESISMAYYIPNFAAGSTEHFHFFTVFADSLLNEDFDMPDFVYSGAGTIIENDSIGDTVYACGAMDVEVDTYSADNYDWSWSPNTYLSTDTGFLVTVNPLDTVTYTVTGTPIGLGPTYVLTFTAIPSTDPVINFTAPGLHCGTYDLGTLVFSDIAAVSNDWSFHSDLPANAFDTSNYFPTTVDATPYDSIYLMMIDSTTGCFDVEFINITWQDVLFEIQVTTTACDTNNGTASLAGITAAPGTYSILWSTGDTTNSVSGLPAGPISCDITGPGGCVTTNSISVQENSITFAFNVTDAGCGNPSGSISATMNGDPSNAYSYNWSTGDSTADLTNIYSGFYSLTVTNQDGCTYFDTVTVQNVVTTFSLSTTVLDAACSTCANGSIYTFLSGAPILPVTYVWNNGATTPNIFGLLPGTYYLTATDAIGCMYSDTFFVGYPGSVNDLGNEFGLNLFPNPANNELHINASVNISAIHVFGVDGRIIFEAMPLDRKVKLDISGLVKGVYSVKITLNNQSRTMKFLKL